MSQNLSHVQWIFVRTLSPVNLLQRGHYRYCRFPLVKFTFATDFTFSNIIFYLSAHTWPITVGGCFDLTNLLAMSKYSASRVPWTSCNIGVFWLLGCRVSTFTSYLLPRDLVMHGIILMILNNKIGTCLFIVNHLLKFSLEP